MGDFLKKLARQLLIAQLADPSTRASLHAYVDAQVDTEYDKLVATLDDKNPFLRVVKEAASRPGIKTDLHQLIDAEFDALLAVVTSKL